MSRVLEKAGWRKRDENAWGLVTARLDSYYYRGVPMDEPLREYNVWWDAPNAEWFVKVEGETKHFGRWCGWHQLQGQAFKSGIEMLKWLKAYDQERLPQGFMLGEARDPKALLKALIAPYAPHVTELCFHLYYLGTHYAIDWRGCISLHKEVEVSPADASANRFSGLWHFSGQWRVLGMSEDRRTGGPSWLGWDKIRAKALFGNAVVGYVHDINDGEDLVWGSAKGVLSADPQGLSKRHQARPVAELSR